MKKVLLVVALLLLATPLYAVDVTVTQTPGTASGNLAPITIGWSGAAESNSIRGFALELTVDSGTNLTNIRDFNRGESTRAGGGFGIFPGKFRDNVNPVYADACMALPAYNPIAPSGDLNGTGGDGQARMVVELGTLFTEPCSPGVSGTLFTIDVNKAPVSGISSCTMCVRADATRGGVVKKDATAANVGLPGTNGCFTVNFAPSGVTVPNVLTMNRVDARNAITALGLTVTEVNVAPTAAGQHRTIIAQNPAGGTVVPPASAVTINAVSYPVKDSAPASMYANWVTSGRPQCWAYARQCRGDADGKAAFGVWVSNADLNILRGALTKPVSSIPAGGRCADFDHKAAFGVWVSNADLNILRLYLTKAATLVPLCGSVGTTIPSADANYWYYCIPTGGAACPAGQTCAPIGICPNTP